jgi:uncharacterized membrane-anchored protein YitT (DUF2179 family)
MKTIKWLMILGGASGLLLTALYHFSILSTTGDPVSYTIYFFINALLLLLCGVFFNKKWAPFLFLFLIISILSSILIPIEDSEGWFTNLFLYGIMGSLLFIATVLPLLFWGGIIGGLLFISKWFKSVKTAK